MQEKLERICAVIEHYLSDIFGRIRVYRDETNFLIPWGSTVINVIVLEEDDVYINVNSPVALKVHPSKDLMKFLLSENANLKMASFFTEFEKGFMDIIVGVKIRYRDLSRELLKFAVLNIGNLANEYGREIIAVFGGLSFKEYLDREKYSYPYSCEKLFQERISVNDTSLLLEVYVKEENYTIVCREEGSSSYLIKAIRKVKNPYEALKILEKAKESIQSKDFVSLRKLFNPYEVDFFELYSVFLKGKDNTKLKKLEKEIHELPYMLINGKITYEEYKKRIKEIEREIGLSE